MISRGDGVVVPTEWDPWALQHHYDKLAAERAAASAAAEPKQSAEPQPKQRRRKTKGTQTVKVCKSKGTQTPTITEPKKKAKKKLHKNGQTETAPPPQPDEQADHPDPLDGLWHASELPSSVVASMGAGVRYESAPLGERTGMQVEIVRRPRL